MNRYTIDGNTIVLDRLSALVLPNDLPIEVVVMAHIVRCFYNVRVNLLGGYDRELIEDLAFILTPATTPESQSSRAIKFANFRPKLHQYLQNVLATIGQGTTSIICPVACTDAYQLETLSLTLGSDLISFP